MIQGSRPIKQSFTIRLHKNIEKFEDVIKPDLLDSDDWGDYTKVDIDQQYGLGKIYLSPSISNTPNWKYLLLELSDQKAVASNNSYSKALIVFKLTNFKKPKYVSIAIGYGDSMIDKTTVVNDFGKVIAAKRIDSRNMNAVDTTEITDIILQSSRQIVGTQQNGMRSILGSRSEFPRSIRGTMVHGQTEIDLIGNNDTLKATRLMTLNELVPDLEFYVSSYENKNIKQASWANRFLEIKPKDVKNQLTEKFAHNILNGDDFAIVWPYITDVGEYRITGINQKDKTIIGDLSAPYLSAIKISKLGSKQLVSKFTRDRLINTESGQSVSIFQALIGDLIDSGKRYLLFNGLWFQIADNFYKEIQSEFRAVNNSSLPFISNKKGNSEDDYNLQLSTLHLMQIMFRVKSYTGSYFRVLI
ncbi:hypothetical protein OENI_60020 [Oenococcus oeni]|uniref:DUF6119 family protein n=1 Tax=Oenococcus oeni TaxID=1247 RepID=UPI0010BBDED5|nr:DUF6119 family protein [Oenococcus oeni]SYW05532.1 hypothetical protein OENI_60020 [Oenococcus oeni]